MTKPFPIRELVARVRAAVRRSQNPPVDMIKNTVITIGQITLDPARRLVQKSGAAVHLTPKEFDLLHHLMKHAGLPMMHARFLGAVWGPEYGNELEYLRTFIRQFRKKLEDDRGAPHVSSDGFAHRVSVPRRTLASRGPQILVRSVQ